ncbi:MAG: hypothetical protein KBT48_04770 [Firmicutes bacterium]|nr:hypothetical protein [Bacillota bacterium]
MKGFFKVTFWALVTVAVIMMGVIYILPSTNTEPTPEQTQEAVEYVVSKDEIVEVAKMAVEENQFTQPLVVTSSKKVPFLNIELPWTRNEISAKIEGIIGIGIQADQLEIQRDMDESGNWVGYLVILPKSEVLYKEIKDTVISQNNGLLNNNPVSVDYYNQKIEELVKEKIDMLAEEGKFEKADNKLQELIAQRIHQITDESVPVRFETK